MARRSRSKPGLSLAEVAEITGARLEGDAQRRIQGVAEPDRATETDLVFVIDAAHAAALAGGAAAAVLLPAGLELPESDGPGQPARLTVDDPQTAVLAVLERLYPLVRAAAGVHPSAVIGQDVALDAGASVGAAAVIEDGASVGAGSEIGPGCYLGAGVRVGADCLLHPNVSLHEGSVLGDRVVVYSGAVVGSDGFGFAGQGRRQTRIPQIGGVVIEDDVEIGANACIDRGALRDTRIGAGTKIDNLVQIGHNCDVGRDCALSGLTGLSGSTRLEDGVIAGGNVGFAGHLTVGEGAMLAAKSGVHSDVAPGAVVGGIPAIDMSHFRRIVAAWNRLPELLRRVRRLERSAPDASED